MNVPETVKTAIEDRQVEGATCLEAGAGVGKMTAALLDAGAKRVYAVTDDTGHAETVRERFGRNCDRLAVIEADLRETPLAADSVDLVTCHALCNVLAPAVLDAVATELTRVAAPGGQLLIDDYDPLPDDAAISDLFAVGNAATELATGDPALSFYPASMLRRLFAGFGWTVEREWTLLDPVPWTEQHVAAHANAAKSAASQLPSVLGAPLRAAADRRASEIGSERAGRMYSLALSRSEADRPRI